jgi:hypothetical protein
MRVLLFDIDGVLNDHTWNPVAKSNSILPRCVDQFNRIILKTDCKLVISSAWRYMVIGNAVTLDGFSYMLRTHGVIDHTIIGMTASDEEIENRNDQILTWVKGRNDVTSWVAIDDLSLVLPDDHFVQTDPKIGLTEDKADEVIRKLIGV